MSRCPGHNVSIEVAISAEVSHQGINTRCFYGIYIFIYFFPFPQSILNPCLSKTQLVNIRKLNYNCFFVLHLYHSDFNVVSYSINLSLFIYFLYSDPKYHFFVDTKYLCCRYLCSIEVHTFFSPLLYTVVLVI